MILRWPQRDTRGPPSKVYMMTKVGVSTFRVPWCQNGEAQAMAARRDRGQLCRAPSVSFLWAPPCWGPGTEDTDPQKPLPEEPTHAQGGGVKGWTGSLVRLLGSAQAKVTPRRR